MAVDFTIHHRFDFVVSKNKIYGFRCGGNPGGVSGTN